MKLSPLRPSALTYSSVPTSTKASSSILFAQQCQNQSPPRVYLEAPDINSRIGKESTSHTKVASLADSLALRKSQMKHFEDCADYNILKSMKDKRQKKQQNSINLILNNRFPKITGNTGVPVNYDIFKDPWQPRAQEGDPFLKKEEERRQIYLPRKINKQTISSTVKGRVLLEALAHHQHRSPSPPSRFIPVNPSEAKDVIKRVVNYDLDVFGRVSQQEQRRQTVESMNSQRRSESGDKRSRSKTHGQSMISKSIQESPSKNFKSFKDALNSKNAFETFLPESVEQPRLNILNNFKSINRVMRSSFLKDAHDVPDNQMNQFHQVKDLALKMTRIMKQMGSVNRFAASTGKKVSLSKQILRQLKRKDGSLFQEIDQTSKQMSTLFDVNLLNQDSTPELQKMETDIFSTENDYTEKVHKKRVVGFKGVTKSHDLGKAMMILAVSK